MKKEKLVVIAGTNASGKSALGIEMAKRFNGEILSADSRQIFEGFDLCCGKVTAEERAEVTHHMLDVRRVGEPYSVSEYQEECYRLVPEIAARGHLPLMVGGTGLYISAVVHGYSTMQGEPDPELRRELEGKSLEELRAMLPKAEYERLKGNPSDWQNKRRLIRCIEKSRGPAEVRQNEPRFDVLMLGLTWPMETLEKRIHERLRIRMEQGMLKEVKDYLDAGGDPQALYDLGLEYRFLLARCRGEYGSDAEMCRDLATAIRQFAKRQVTWFRREKDLQWLDVTGDYVSEAADRISEFIVN